MTFTTSFRIKRLADCVKLQPLDFGDLALFDKLQGSEYYVGTFETPSKRKTYDQVKTVWKLVSVIFQSQEGRKGTKDELYSMYTDLLDEYAMKRPSSLNTEKLVPIHVSEADTKACAYFIEGLMIHLSEYCSLPMNAQTEVREILFEWENWRGNLGVDTVIQCSEQEYRERHPFSEASGKGGCLHLHHIVTKGSNEKLRHITANWLMLTVEEHEKLHRYGYKWFIETFPHLRGKIENAFSL